jgi:hypothetical protein
MNSLEIKSLLSVIKQNIFGNTSLTLILHYYEMYRNFANEELVPKFWSLFGSK